MARLLSSLRRLVGADYGGAGPDPARAWATLTAHAALVCLAAHRCPHPRMAYLRGEEGRAPVDRRRDEGTLLAASHWSDYSRIAIEWDEAGQPESEPATGARAVHEAMISARWRAGGARAIGASGGGR